MSQVAVSKTLVIAKVEAEKRLVTAIASVVSKADGTPVVDTHGDSIHIDDLEAAFNEAFGIRGGLRKGGEMHESIGGADIVQAFTFSKAEWAKLGEQTEVDLSKMPELGIVKFHVHDDALWSKIKSGELGDVSIGGTAERLVA